MDFLRNPEIRKLVKVYVFLTVFEVLGAAVLTSEIYKMTVRLRDQAVYRGNIMDLLKDDALR